MATQLSLEQLQAVETDERAVVVTASAGSGKTEVVARRVERLLEESTNDSFRVLALSYTVKAADELRNRLASRVGDVRRVDTDTIHAFAHNLIRQHGTWIGLPQEPEVLHRDEDRAELLAEWLAESGTFLDASDTQVLLQEIDLARAELRSAAYLSEYREALATRGALDYPAMLDVATRLLEHEWVRTQLHQTYRHLIVDEAQNLTPAQYRLLASVLGPPPSPVSAMLIGDEKQSIVQFAGADPALIRRFEKDYRAKRVRLTRNFRSATALARLANAVTMELGDTAQLQAVSAAQGSVTFAIAATEQLEGHDTAEWVQHLLFDDGLPGSALAPGEDPKLRPDEIAVLARSGAALRWVATELGSRGIDFVQGSDPRSWMSSQLGRALADLIAFRAGPNHRSNQAHLAESASTSLDTLASSPVLGLAAIVRESDADDPAALVAAIEAVSDQDQEQGWQDDRAVLLATWASFLDRTPTTERNYPNLQLHIARMQRGELNAPGVRLLTVHKSQGREFRAVSVIGLNDGQFPDFRQTSVDQRRAELHCFYVAVTRASRVLRLSRAAQRSGRNGLWDATESPYLSLARSALRS